MIETKKDLHSDKKKSFSYICLFRKTVLMVGNHMEVTATKLSQEARKGGKKLSKVVRLW